VRVILPVRSPLEVARSFRLRDGFPISKGLLLWLRHALDAEASSHELPTAVTDWADFVADWRFPMARVDQENGLPGSRVSARSAAEIDDFLTPSLNHSAAMDESLIVHPDVNEWVRDAYDAMAALVVDPASESARQTLNDVRVEFERACKIFGRILVDFEENWSVARRRAEEADSKSEQLAVEIADYAARAEPLAAAKDAARAERDSLAAERAVLIGQLEAACAERDAIAQERAVLTGQLEAAIAERDSLAAERDAIAAERPVVIGQLEAAIAERDSLAAERDAIAAERAALAEQLATACAERKSLAAERDAIATERAETIRKLTVATDASVTSLERQADALRLQVNSLSEDNARLFSESDSTQRDLVEKTALLSFANAALRTELLKLTALPDSRLKRGGAFKLFHLLRYKIASFWEAHRLHRAKFDEDAYLKLYPDVAASTTGAALHYVISGRVEGRIAIFKADSESH
jgi:hypothetical protein